MKKSMVSIEEMKEMCDKLYTLSEKEIRELKDVKCIYHYRDYKSVYKWKDLVFKTNARPREKTINAIVSGKYCHPNFYDVHENFVVMDYIEGDMVVDMPCPLSSEQGEALIQAVEDLYSEGIAILDLHNENIVVTPEGIPYIIDTDCYKLISWYADDADPEFAKKREIIDIQRMMN